MTIPTPGADRKGLVSFRLFGFPVSIHASFLVIVLLLGYSAPTGLRGAFVWLVVVTVSVIAHELGHAFVARPAGGDPRIDLYMMAGLTTWQPRNAGRGRRVAVSVAGPFAGVLLGVGLLLLYGAVEPPAGTVLNDVLVDAVYVNLAWGLLNLLPMLPLDGGQVVLALMPGPDEIARVRRASYASLVVAAVVALGAIAWGQPIAAALVVFFAAGNLQRVVALRRGAGAIPDVVGEAEVALQRGEAAQVDAMLADAHAVPAEYRFHATVLRAAALVRLGRAREAQHLLLDLPAGVLDPVFEATVLLANDQERLARERLEAALVHEPSAWGVRELVLLLRSRGLDVVSYVGNATGTGAAGVLDALFHTGDFEAAAAWGERALATGATDPGVAYNTACAYARSGDVERSVRALGYAAELGWYDLPMADTDGDLEHVRARPEWPEIRERIAANPRLGPSYAAG